jgi:hypothetical protein
VTERNPDTLPTSADPSGRCPRCNRVSNFTFNGEWQLVVKGGSTGLVVFEKATHFKCQGCNDGMIVAEEKPTWGSTWVPTLWYPTPGAGEREDTIPDAVWTAYEEGVRCIGIQVPNAAAAMLRSALAQVVQNKGSEEARAKRTLQDAVKQMVKEGSLLPTFGEWADQIREMGNAGVHPEVYGAVSQTEAEDLQGLVKSMLDYLYVVPASIKRTRAAREAAASESQPAQ